MKHLIFTSLIAVLSLAGCAQSNEVDTNNTENTTAVTIIKRVAKEEFKTYLDAHENAQLIDVRTPEEFQSGNIAGSSNINFNDSKFENNINRLDKNIPVLIYCRSGGRSAKALKIFEKNGFTTVLELEGGFLNW